MPGANTICKQLLSGGQIYYLSDYCGCECNTCYYVHGLVPRECCDLLPEDDWDDDYSNRIRPGYRFIGHDYIVID